MTSRSLDRQNAKFAQRRALKALEDGVWHHDQAQSWARLYREPASSRALQAKAKLEYARHSERAFNHFTTVRVALGYDPTADEPEPARHWDAGAMED